MWCLYIYLFDEKLKHFKQFLNMHCLFTVKEGKLFGVSKQSILKSPISFVLTFTGWIKHIFDTVDLYHFSLKQSNPTFEVE